MRYDRALYCLVDVVFWVSVESMCWLSLNGERKGCEGPWMFWPVLTLISRRRRVSWEDNKELPILSCCSIHDHHICLCACTKTPAHSCLWNAGFSGPQCPEKMLVRSQRKMNVGLGCLGLLAVGKTSMMGRWEFSHAGTFGGLWAFLGISHLGSASLWYGLSAWVSSVYASRSFWACCSTERHGVSGMYDYVESNWCAKLVLLTFVLAWLKVEIVVRKRQYGLRAQFMRLCGHQSMMSDAHRAGPNLQNQIFFF